MQAVIDLNARQTRRVLEQAIRAGTALDIEPRTRSDCVLTGMIAGQEDEVLRVDLTSGAAAMPLHVLVGAYCDVRMVVARQLYMFSTCLIDAIGHGSDQRLLLAVPEGVQVANRRKFERRTLSEFAQVRLWPKNTPTPYIGELCNLSCDGIACRMVRGDLDELLLVGDVIEVGFDLPGDHESFRLPAIVCDKAPTKDHQQLLVGLEFAKNGNDALARLALDRLHAALCDLTMKPGTDGER